MNTDMCNLKSSQREESRGQSADYLESLPQIYSF